MEPGVAKQDGFVDESVEIDLTNCDREPIHIPGTILPHGVMLVVDPKSLTIEQLAGDTSAMLGREPATLIGANLGNLLTPAQLDVFRRAVINAPLLKPRHLLDPAMRVLPSRAVDASVHTSGDALVIEIEDADLEDQHADDPLACVQQMIQGLDRAPSLQSFCQIAADRVREVARYDRVMVYRFMEDDSGWVFAESRDEALPPFLNLHYPASDIPKQARALYLTSPIRLVTQIDYDPAPLLPAHNERTGVPLDMSHAVLRDVSPIHREYLRNMGVEASMSISITREGKLWGLIACHNQSPRRLPRHLRAACELFSSIFSLQLEARERGEQFEARTASRKVLQDMMRNLASEDNYAIGLVRQSPNLLDYVSAGGVALRVGAQGGVAIKVNNAVTTLRDTPSDEQINALTDWLTREMENGDGMFTTDRLGELWPPAREFADIGSGVLAISVSREPRDFILWFRPEVVQTVSWGGDPHKPVEMGPNGDRLTPRKSFEVWKETVRGRSMPWLPSDDDAAFDLRVSLLEIVLRRIDAAARERDRAFKQERLLMAELDHRVKNTLANIQALVTQTSRRADSLTDFVTSLEGRIRAMAKAHSLLSESRWEGVSVRRLISDELAPYGHNGEVTSLLGPDVTLTPDTALSLSLAIHELATNAAKYGAFTAAHGHVSVRWNQTAEGGLSIKWVESGGPSVAKPQKRGFGTTLIERVLSSDTRGKATLHFEPDGVVCDIILPSAAVIAFSEEDKKITVAPRQMAIPLRDDDQPMRILVVEDSTLVFMLIEEMCISAGWEIIGPATRVAQALTLAKTGQFDVALLDVNLAGEMSWDVAAILSARGIPFAFSTGYDRSAILPEAFRDAAVLAKPFNLADAEQLIRELTTSVKPDLAVSA